MSTIHNHTTTLTLTIAGEENELEATVRYINLPASRGARERGTGLQLEPDEEASVEILSVRVRAEDESVLWVEGLLSDKQTKAIEAEIMGAGE